MNAQDTQLAADVAALQQAEADAKGRVATAVAALQAQITALQNAAPGDDISAQLTAIESTTADLATFAQAAPTPTSVPPASTVTGSTGTDTTAASAGTDTTTAASGN